MPVLKGNKSFYDYEVSDFLAFNLKSWLDYGLLEMGAYTNALFTLPGTSGYTNLIKSKDTRYPNAYEGKGSWIWEEDVNPIGGIEKPLNVSGVYVNNTFYPTATTSGPYAHKIDYVNGRVLFNNSIGAASVKCEYGFRDVVTYLVDDKQFRIITDEFASGNIQASGSYLAVLKQNRVWFPSIVIEVGDRTNEPLQLGGGEINIFNVDYHIFSDQGFTNRRIADLLGNQYQTSLNLYNINDVKYPYKYDGTLASGALTYPVLSNEVGPYFWDKAYIVATDGGPRNAESDLYRAECTHSIQIDRHLINY